MVSDVLNRHPRILSLSEFFSFVGLQAFRRLIRFTSPELEDEAWLRAASAIPRPTRSRFAKLEPADQDAVARACRLGLELLGYPL